MIQKIKKNQNGQGLLELVIAIGVIVSGLFAVWSLFLSNYSGEEEAQARIVGANLAREGVEAVKNIRDSNWLKIDVNETGVFWDSGLNNDGTLVISDLFNPTGVVVDFTPNSIDDDAAKIYINKNTGFYDADLNGQATSYRRLITLKNICCVDNNPQDLQCDNVDTEIQNIGIGCGGDLKIGLDVSSQVKWTVAGKSKEMTVEDQLFNWR